jgi:predicted ArsR family transcriptional regulator
MTAKLTSRQADVLGVVEGNGPVTARDVGEYHLPIGISSARSHLNALERKGFVSAVYTGSGVSMTARSYVITDEGAEALAAADAETDDGFEDFMASRDERVRNRRNAAQANKGES